MGNGQWAVRNRQRVALAACWGGPPVMRDGRIQPPATHLAPHSLTTANSPITPRSFLSQRRGDRKGRTGIETRGRRAIRRMQGERSRGNDRYPPAPCSDSCFLLLACGHLLHVHPAAARVADSGGLRMNTIHRLNQEQTRVHAAGALTFSPARGHRGPNTPVCGMTVRWRADLPLYLLVYAIRWLDAVWWLGSRFTGPGEGGVAQHSDRCERR